MNPLASVDLLVLTVFGGFMALEGTGFGQFMLSRPLVSATIAGGMVGDPVTGLGVGVLLELYYISVLPVGGARFPEGGPAAVVAGALAAQTASAGGLALAVFFGLVWGRLAGATITGLRLLNARWAIHPEAGPVPPRKLVSVHLAGMVADLARGMTLTISGLLLALWLGEVLTPAWPLGRSATLALIVVGAAAPMGTLLAELGGWRERGALFLGGLGGGVLLGMIL